MLNIVCCSSNVAVRVPACVPSHDRARAIGVRPAPSSTDDVTAMSAPAATETRVTWRSHRWRSSRSLDARPRSRKEIAGQVTDPDRRRPAPLGQDRRCVCARHRLHVLRCRDLRAAASPGSSASRSGPATRRPTPTSSTSRSSGPPDHPFTWEHPLGLAPRHRRRQPRRVLYGARTSLVIAIIATVVATIIGIVVGLVAGFARGWLDRFISFVTDLFLSFPFLLVALALAPIIIAAVQRPATARPGPGRIALIASWCLRLDGAGPADPRPGALAARARVHPGRPGDRRPDPAASCSRSCCPTWWRRSWWRSRWRCRRSWPPRPACRSSASGSPASRRWARWSPTPCRYYADYPLYLWTPVLVIAAPVARPEPPGRLDPRRLRPQDSPVTTVTARDVTNNHGKVWTKNAVQETGRRRSATAALLALAACGGGGDDDATATTAATRSTARARQHRRRQGPRPRGPARDRGRRGGRHRHGADRRPGARPRSTRREIYYTDTNSILQGLRHPLADPVRLRRGERRHDPGARPGHRPRHAQRGLHRVDVHDPRRREVRGRRPRSPPRTSPSASTARCDRRTFPERPGLLSTTYFLGGDNTGPVHRQGRRLRRASRSTATTSRSRCPGRSRTCPTTRSFPAMGPIPRGQGHRPGQVRSTRWRPARTRSRSTRREVADPGPQRPVGPGDRPGPHQYPDELRLRVRRRNAPRSTRSCSPTGRGADHADLRRRHGAELPQVPGATHADRLVVGTRRARTGRLDYRKITDINVRQALVWAYPYADASTAAGLIAGVTAIPATSSCRPASPAARSTTAARARAGHDRPGEGQGAARGGRQRAGLRDQVPVRTDDPTTVGRQGRLVKGLEAAGFKATPVADDRVETTPARPRHRTQTINIRVRLVLGLAVGSARGSRRC